MYTFIFLTFEDQRHFNQHITSIFAFLQLEVQDSFNKVKKYEYILTKTILLNFYIARSSSKVEKRESPSLHLAAFSAATSLFSSSESPATNLVSL